MQKTILALMVLLVAPFSISYATFSSEITILEKKDIVKLTDDQLIDAYLDAVVEIDATRSFHNTSGFSTKDFKDFKALLKYRLELLIEIHSRNLEIPQFERY